MNFVQPIRDPEQIQQLKDYFKEKSLRNYILFIMGINTGLRISDILKLKVVGSHISMREKKTGKQKRIQITAALKRELKWFIEEREEQEYLLQSRQGKNRPIGRSMAYKILSGAAAEFGLDEIGTHTLRKTYGYHMYMQTKNIALLMEIFNHSLEKVTLRYIGVNQDAMDKAMTRFKI
ncbi:MULTISPECIES: site-specific integrase [Bacillus cereus group]|uniref:Site-specific integrase n=1 Tax=Bacillus wiedmannii TaxID=1890302 RepID=A0ABD6THB8_9BACI|nr:MULTISPECIES: site-specific integrase [Bacillus cereus group]KAA0792448.1 site-specific integrase [Bacillus sp. BB081]MED3396255.1 site-specific integrase [Bacillus wiedmannii]PEO57081.1 site-specific integrase [Bacillus wiedmannii]PEO69635.1 site-specific integrase [Bacillus wiedmannii]PEP73925.1 site-specific integrase [Bacillus wiedmannii]